MSDTVEVVVKVTDQASGALSSIGGNLQKIGGVALGAVAVGLGAAAAGIGALASAAIQGNAQFEQYNTQFGVLLGSAELAKERMAELAEFGASTPFELPQVVEADKILQGFGLHSEEAAEKFGYAGVEIRTIAGDVASGTGASFEEMALLIGKFSAGATGEAISRMQEMGITTRDELAQMGLEFSKSGELLSPLPESMEVVLGLMQDKYGGMMEAQSSTFTGMMSNLQDWKDATIRSLGEPIFEIAKEQLGSLLEFINSPAVMGGLQAFTEGLADGISSVVNAIKFLATGDFQGGIFGLMEDDSRLNILFSLREAFEEFSRTAGQGLTIFERLMEVFDNFLPEELIFKIWDLYDVFLRITTPIIELVRRMVSWQDIMAVLGIAIASIILPVIISLITTLAPLIATFVGLVALVSLLRNVWESDFMGIRTALIEFWEVTARPYLEQLWQWLQVNVPLALETLRAYWVDIAWPAIQNAIQIVWPIIQAIFQAYVTYITDFFIPAVKQLYEFWVNTAWPAIKSAIEFVWPVVKYILEAMWHSLTTIILPAIQTLYEYWVNVAWPAIKQALDDAWAVMQPLLEEARVWLEENIPVALASLQSSWSTIWATLSGMVDPALSAIDSIYTAVRNFWEFISSHVFDFQINIPDLPDWAIPGSPLPIHTAWEDFNNYMGSAANNLGNIGGGDNSRTINQSNIWNINTAGVRTDSERRGALAMAGGI